MTPRDIPDPSDLCHLDVWHAWGTRIVVYPKKLLGMIAYLSQFVMHMGADMLS